MFKKETPYRIQLPLAATVSLLLHSSRVSTCPISLPTSVCLSLCTPLPLQHSGDWGCEFWDILGYMVKFWLSWLSLKKKKKKKATDFTQAHWPRPPFNTLAIFRTTEHVIVLSWRALVPRDHVCIIALFMMEWYTHYTLNLHYEHITMLSLHLKSTRKKKNIKYWFKMLGNFHDVNISMVNLTASGFGRN